MERLEPSFYPCQLLAQKVLRQSNSYRSEDISLRIGILPINELNGMMYLYRIRFSISHMYNLKSNALIIIEKYIHYV